MEVHTKRRKVMMIRVIAPAMIGRNGTNPFGDQGMSRCPWSSSTCGLWSLASSKAVEHGIMVCLLTILDWPGHRAFAQDSEFANLGMGLPRCWSARKHWLIGSILMLEIRNTLRRSHATY
jgi:hypothetical protein